MFQGHFPARKPKLVLDDEDFGPALPPARPWLGIRRPTLIEALLLTAIFGVLAGLLIPSNDRDYTPRYPPEQPGDKAAFADPAGAYHLGSRGRSWSLNVLPDGRYSFVWGCCTGITARESGYAHRVNGRVYLMLAREGRSVIPSVYQVIPWGNRTYLIPTEAMDEFCDAIVSGEEPRGDGRGYFLMRRHAGPGAVGLPRLPEPWGRSVRERVVLGTIRSIDDRGRATIDLGTADGVRAGTLLAIQGQGEALNPRCLKVLSADEHSCTAEDQWSRKDSGDPRLQAGWSIVATMDQDADFSKN